MSMPGVVGGAAFLGLQPPTSTAQQLSVIDAIANINPSELPTIRPPASDGYEFVESGDREVISGRSMRVPESTSDGIPRDYGRSDIMVVFDPVGDGRDQPISAREYRQHVMATQGLISPPAVQTQPPPSAVKQAEISMTNPDALADLAGMLQSLLQGSAIPQPPQPPQPPAAAYQQAPSPQWGAPQLPLGQVLRPGLSPGYLPYQPPTGEPPAVSGVSAEAFGLDFLTPVPSKPQQRVIFNLGVGGLHKKRYHHVVYNGQACLSLIYDSRYDDEEFAPPEQVDGAGEAISFTVEVPALQLLFTCMAQTSMNTEIGCLHVVNLIVLDSKPA